MRLDKYIQRLRGCGKSAARLKIAGGEVTVEGQEIRDNLYEVHKLDRVELTGVEIEMDDHLERKYILLNKPAGCVSATTDPEHQTVVDLIAESYAATLHLAGRLDKESTGMLILTNDGQWSRRITEPKGSVPKRYLVTTEKPISEETAGRFADGIYFAYEDITTLPAEIEMVAENQAVMTIYEGKYHQIKRMFHAVGNRVIGLHRLSIGELELGELESGKYRELSADEVSIF